MTDIGRTKKRERGTKVTLVEQRSERGTKVTDTGRTKKTERNKGDRHW